MARKPAVELAREWFSHAERGDAQGMGSVLSDDAVFHLSFVKGQRFTGREAIERYFAASGFDAVAYAYTAVDDEYAVVTLSLRRTLERRGLADTTLAMVFKADGDEIVCMDAFTSTDEALATIATR
jgi:ketosteroid isomerase-like protein